MDRHQAAGPDVLQLMPRGKRPETPLAGDRPVLPPTFLDRKSPRSWQLTAGTSYYRQPNRGSARGFQDKIYRNLKFKHKRPCRESITVAEAALPAGEKQWKSGFIMNFTAGRSRPRRLRSRRRWDKSRRQTAGGSTRSGSPKFTS